MANATTTTLLLLGELDSSLQFHLLPLGWRTNFEIIHVFSLWENTLNLTTCGGCDVPARLALAKHTNERERKRSGEALRNADSQNNLRESRGDGLSQKSRVFTCVAAQFTFPLSFLSRKKKCFTSEKLDGFVAKSVA